MSISFSSFFTGKRILVTGSNGFVARNFIEKLKTLDCTIHGIDLSDNRNEDITFHNTDLTDAGALTPLLKDIDPNLIFHTAAIVTAERDNSLFSAMLRLHCESLHIIFNALHETKSLELVVNFGTTEEYGDYGGKPFCEDMLEKSLSPYAVTKTAGVHLANMLGKNDNFPVISVRPGVLFGKYQQENKFLPYILKQLRNNETLELSLCSQTRDFISVNSFIAILLQLAASGKYTPGEVYNIASGESFSLKEIVEAAKETLNSTSKINYGALPLRENEIMQFNVSIEKIKSILNSSLDSTFYKDYQDVIKENL